jgi:hypothetical protein
MESTVRLVFLLIFYLLIKLVVVGLGVGFGFLLRWLIPAIETGTAVLIGVIATGLTIHFLGRLMAFADSNDPTDPELDLERIPRVVVLDPMEPLRSRRSRKRKPS